MLVFLGISNAVFLRYVAVVLWVFPPAGEKFSPCSFSLLVQRKRTKRKDPFAEEFFAVGKNRSKTPRRYAPVFGAFQRIFCTSGFRAAHGIKYKSIVNLGVRGPGVEAKALGTS